jgi:ArsR family transcriptional regulator
MERIARLFKALSEPVRLQIVGELLRREACVCELQAHLGLPQSLVSRHLAYLRGAGLVAARRRQTRVYYALALDDAIGAALRELLARALNPVPAGGE